ncbi:MAG: hypothetical protein Q7U68_05935, partial [Candidatus Roizmanbacteria bacterium]|nr:hypothetical protein [Candidatus Roizmanbacteria bacterium]
MKRILTILVLFFTVVFLLPNFVLGQQATPIPTEPIPRAYECKPEFDEIYKQISQKTNKPEEKCTTNYQEFKSNPTLYHYWTDDEEVTIQGRSNERARQFIYWVTTHASIDNHPALTKVWSTARNLSYFFVILTAALLGLGIIIGQRTNFETGIKLWPAVTRILTSLLYISFSATIVVTIVQLSEVMMKFFIENLGGKDLFNIYFSGISKESNYSFYGIKDLNIGAQESIKTQLFMLKLTNISYYFMGGMLLLRKIILWFLLFVSPFLAILLSFAFIKNVGMIWIGVFFQWVFYGPLLALFLGGLATIWKAGIPFIFDFSRSGTAAGYIYPTATNITWGGPAQRLTLLNNINYIDPYVEYIITLIMLWAVTIFPWWLLRIFRDYCCEGINAMKNMMLSAINPGKGGAPSPILSPANLSSNLGAVLKIPRETETSVRTRIETVEEIKKARTEEITQSLNIKASKIIDVAHFETNKTVNETVNKNINYLKNPIQAPTSAERQKYMNIRSELSSRAAKSDVAARQIIGVFTASKMEQAHFRQNIITTLPKAVPVTQVISFRVKLPQEKVQQVSSSVANAVIADNNLISTISQKTGVAVDKTSQILSLLHQSINAPATEIVQKISTTTNTEKDKVIAVIKEFSAQVKSDVKIAEAVAKEQNLNSEQVKQVVAAQTPMVVDSEKNIDQMIIPQTVSIDEYEQVKKMWTHQYEKGEVPVTENIKTRDVWVDQDIIIITNTLNKLFSSDEKVKEQGLDDVGYILPIFLVNNLTG